MNLPIEICSLILNYTPFHHTFNEIGVWYGRFRAIDHVYTVVHIGCGHIVLKQQGPTHMFYHNAFRHLVDEKIKNHNCLA